MIEHLHYVEQLNRLFGAFGKLGHNGSPVGGMIWFAKELEKEIGQKLDNRQFDNLVSSIIRGADRLPSIAKIIEMANNILPEKTFDNDKRPMAKKGFVSVMGYLIKQQMIYQIPDNERQNIINSLLAFNGFDATKDEIKEAKETIDSIIIQKKWPIHSSGVWKATTERYLHLANGHGGK